MTPWLFRLCVEANIERDKMQHNRKAWMMWHGAVLSRMSKKMPKLDQFLLGGKKQMKGIDEAAIIEHLRAYQKRRDKCQQ